MKNVLWLTGIFPPMSCGIGRQPKLAKYLKREHEWNPIVLAFDKSMFRPMMDEGLLKDVEELEVHRTKSGESELLQRWLPYALSLARMRTPSWWKVPDPWIRWRKHALEEARQILRSTPIDAIFSSAPPYTCHLVARDLRRMHGNIIPWVADFRDFWTQQDASYTKRKPIEEEMEKSVMEEADWLTIVNEMGLETLRGKYPEIEGKSSSITHGYDPEDYEGLPTATRADVCTMTYFGTLYGERMKGAIAFLEALREFYLECTSKGQRPNLQVDFVGNCGQIVPTIKRLDLDLAGVGVHPWVNKRQALEMMARSDVLLFILGDSRVDRHASTGKLFDYLALRKPIMAIAPEGVARDIINETRIGVVVHPSDIERMKGVIKSFASEKVLEGQLDTPEPKGVEQYDIRNKAREMAEVLEGICTA